MLNWSLAAQQRLSVGGHPGFALVTTDFVASLYRRWQDPKNPASTTVALGIVDAAPVDENRLFEALSEAGQLFSRRRATAMSARRLRSQRRLAPFSIEFDWRDGQRNTDLLPWAHCFRLEVIDRSDKMAVSQPRAAFAARRSRRQIHFLQTQSPGPRRVIRRTPQSSPGNPKHTPLSALRPRAPHIRKSMRQAQRRERHFEKIAILCLRKSLRERFDWVEQFDALSPAQAKKWALKGGLENLPDNPPDGVHLCSQFLRASADASVLGADLRLSESSAQAAAQARRL